MGNRYPYQLLEAGDATPTDNDELRQRLVWQVPSAVDSIWSMHCPCGQRSFLFHGSSGPTFSDDGDSVLYLEKPIDHLEEHGCKFTVSSGDPKMDASATCPGASTIRG